MTGTHLRSVGIDAVDIDRFRRAVQRQPRILDRVFSAGERSDMAKRKDPMPGFAARFAAREAVMKALGVGIGDVAFADIEIVRAESGKPGLRLAGSAAKLANDQGISSWHISISHTETVAMAVVAAS